MSNLKKALFVLFVTAFFAVTVYAERETNKVVNSPAYKAETPVNITKKSCWTRRGMAGQSKPVSR
jgi:hypothetical protein